jgi:hypothetical protein
MKVKRVMKKKSKKMKKVRTM